jgi:hypothetical protein
MSHHSHNQFVNEANASFEGADSQLRQEMRKLMGEYPNGRMNADDAGAIAMAVGHEDGRVVIKFPKPVAWIGFSGDEAIALAQTLIDHARKAGITAPAILRIGE